MLYFDTEIHTPYLKRFINYNKPIIKCGYRSSVVYKYKVLDGSNPARDKIFLFSQKGLDWLWDPKSLRFCGYQGSSLG
jgi:hypothetical protein